MYLLLFTGELVREREYITKTFVHKYCLLPQTINDYITHFINDFIYLFIYLFICLYVYPMSVCF